MLRRWQEEMREGIEAVGADTPAGSRLEETRRFYTLLCHSYKNGDPAGEHGGGGHGH